MRHPMPIVTIQALEPADPRTLDQLLGSVVRDLAAALGTEPGNVWANFSPMAAVQEGDSTEDYHPVVTILAQARPEDAMRKGLEAVAKAVSAGLELPLEKAWVHWVTVEPTRVFADGKVSK